VVIQSSPAPRPPADTLDTVERVLVSSLLIVGDAYARPLPDELVERPRPMSSLRFVLTGGAVLSQSVKSQMMELLPAITIIDVLGSSETGRQGVQASDRQRGAATGVFQPSPSARVISADRERILAPGDPELGWLTQTGRVPLGYLGDPAKTAATFPTVDGERHAVAGDRARLLADGSIELHGRDSVTINTGGEKVFAEEVEQVLKQHPMVFDVLVVGRPSQRWGQEVVAVLQLRPGPDPGDDELRSVVREHLAPYKVPKAIVRVTAIERSPSGKPDYRWATVVAAGSV
jgi:fatty-acyl-CoA synthase